MSAYCRFCATNWLNIGACVQLREVSIECRFILQYMWGKKFGNSASGHLTEGVRLIWGPLNTGFTVEKTNDLLQHFSSFNTTSEMNFVSSPFGNRIFSIRA